MQYYTDSLHKIVYATDASVHREIPYGVAYPETEALTNFEKFQQETIADMEMQNECVQVMTALPQNEHMFVGFGTYVHTPMKICSGRDEHRFGKIAS